jgi:predicted ATPase
MRLSITNIGKLSHADIEIDGITVIAGENSTGKSTVGKILFCVFNSFYEIDKRIEKERERNIEQNLSFAYSMAMDKRLESDTSESLAEQITQNKERYLGNKERLKEDLRQVFISGGANEKELPKSNDVTSVSDKIYQILNISDNEIFISVFKRMLRAEFKMQLNHICQPDLIGEIALQIKDTEVRISIRRDKDIDIDNHMSLNTEVIYMDDPFVLNDIAPKRFSITTLIDEINNFNYTDHIDHLKTKLSRSNDASAIKSVMNEIIVTKKLDAIFERLNSVCEGEITTIGNSRPIYKKNDSDPGLDLLNVSAGMKPFIILKTLLLDGNLEENGTVILDEPEIHLHPEWQIIFAELIVLIQKEFNMHILINTHSPYFLDAIDVFSHKHGISDKCKYYLAENIGEMAVIADVSDEIEKIYAKLSRPLQTLENERYADG